MTCLVILVKGPWSFLTREFDRRGSGGLDRFYQHLLAMFSLGPAGLRSVRAFYACGWCYGTRRRAG